MHATTASPASRRPLPTPATTRRVVDAPVRIFHWLFAFSFAGAYLTADSERWRAMHVTLGWVFFGLFVFRVVYGLGAPRHASLGPLWRRLRAVPSASLDALRALRERTIDPAAWRRLAPLLTTSTIAAVLAMVIPMTLSGHGADAGWDAALGGDWLESMHEVVAETTLAALLIHVGVVIVTSLSRRRNLAAPMLTGRIPGPGPDLVRRDRRWLAVVVLVAVVGFIGWQWRESPRGLVPGLGSHARVVTEAAVTRDALGWPPASPARAAQRRGDTRAAMASMAASPRTAPRP